MVIHVYMHWCMGSAFFQLFLLFTLFPQCSFEQAVAIQCMKLAVKAKKVHQKENRNNIPLKWNVMKTPTLSLR